MYFVLIEDILRSVKEQASIDAYYATQIKKHTRPPPDTRMHGSIMSDVFIKSKQTLIKGEWCDACMRQPPLRVLLYCVVLAH